MYWVRNSAYYEVTAKPDFLSGLANVYRDVQIWDEN